MEAKHNNTLVASRVAPIFISSVVSLCTIIIFVLEGQRQERN